MLLASWLGQKTFTLGLKVANRKSKCLFLSLSRCSQNSSSARWSTWLHCPSKKPLHLLAVRGWIRQDRKAHTHTHHRVFSKLCCTLWRCVFFFHPRKQICGRLICSAHVVDPKTSPVHQNKSSCSTIPAFAATPPHYAISCSAENSSPSALDRGLLRSANGENHPFVSYGLWGRRCS